MIESVLDVNVLASGAIGAENVRSAPGEIFRRWENAEFDVALSQHIIDTLRIILARPYFIARMTSDQILRTQNLLIHRARIVPITARIAGVAPDDEDDQVLATAISAGVPYLVTGDRAFLQLGTYGGVQLLSPRAFLAVLDDAHAQPMSSP